VEGEREPVRADAVPRTTRGFRTMFSAFHHFAPDDARRVLADAAAGGSGIAIFEATRRDAKTILITLLTPLIVLLATPFIRPFRWSRLFWTYVLPAIPLVVLFDGVVSCLRTYTTDELRALAAGVGGDQYAWEAGEVGDGPIPVTYLVGVPARRAAATSTGGPARESTAPSTAPVPPPARTPPCLTPGGTAAASRSR
jgi:hypothetical protein